MGRGKRNAAIIISDDEEDEDFLIKSNSSSFKSKRATQSAPKTNHKRTKRPPLSNSCPRLHDDALANGFDEIKQVCDEFNEGITGFKVLAGSGRSKELWVDKYKPSYLEDLAVHKKKVEEVKCWFEDRLSHSKDNTCNNVLLLVGPAGAGKSATVHAVASYLGAKVFEWNTPTPTIWHEHLHNSKSGLRYMSKLEEFENFVERIRKYGSIHSSMSKIVQTPLILLIDDLPAVNGRVVYGRLLRCLHLLVQSVRIPTVLLITEFGKADSAEYNSHYWEELQLSLQKAGAHKVTFNPVTVNSIKKALQKIGRLERFEVSAGQMDQIAKASGGDIRHAITSMQYFCLKPRPMPLVPSAKIRRTSSREILVDVSLECDDLSLHFGRDESLTLFHALGKFLHNKRESEDTIPSASDMSSSSSDTDRNEIHLKEKFLRLPHKMDTPEMVLCQSHGQSRPIADFLYENVLDFINEEAIDDAWVVASYLSGADILLASLNRMTSRSFEAENVVQSVAASVAVRGVLFGNNHPAPPRWHTIRRPKLWEIEQSSLQNRYQLMSQRCDAYSGLTASDPSIFCTELKPILQWLGNRAYEGSGAPHESTDDILEDKSLDGANLDEREEISEDDIED